MIIALNNKCNLGKNEFIDYISKLKQYDFKNNVLLCASPLNIAMIDDNEINIGAQNVSETENGAFTGEISATQLKSYNVKYCIVGHSERRQYQNESMKCINNKIKQLIKTGITPILCIGESKEQKENGETQNYLYEEIITAVNGLTLEERERIIVAYEPIWSIGTGLIPTVNEIDNIIKYVKQFLPNNKVLYGGSANDENIEELSKSTQIDGYLLGGLSLKLDKLASFMSKIK